MTTKSAKHAPVKDIKAPKHAPVKAPAPAKHAAPKAGRASGHLDILALEGVGPVYAKKLAKAGVKDSAALLAADPKGLAAKTEIAEGLIRTWRSMASLLPVKGVGAQYAEVLARTGIESLVDLANCDADKLTARIEALLESKQVTIVGTKVTEKRVASWIAEANKLVDKPVESSPAAIRKAVRAAVEAKQDAATPAPKGKAKKAHKTVVEAKQDAAAPLARGKPKKASKLATEIQQATSNALPRPMKVRQEHPEIKDNQAGSLKWAEEAFWAFFGDEIEQMVTYPAEIFNDRAYSWRCECCDVALRVPRRTTVFHGDYEIQHDDSEGLLVNGERHMPGAYTSAIQVVQPGRLRNPWTGKLIEGKQLGTTGAA
jgi:predicted flap endonuclease-1-like 5' DNA nuclease